MKVTRKFDYPAVPVGTQFNVRLMISLQGERSADETPVNLALALDRSGSMGGEKIEQVKAATRMIASKMRSSDIFSLVTFNERVETVIASAKGSDLKGVDELIGRIYASGNTFLSGGYEEAFRHAWEGARIGCSRILLLSDGQANTGVTDTHRLSEMASSFLKDGVITSTLGAGLDYDADLMTLMACRGGGTANFIEEPQHAVEIFAEELDTIRNLAGTRCTVSFHPSLPGVAAEQLNSYFQEGGAWMVGDISSAEEQLLLLQITLPPLEKPTENLRIGEITVRWVPFEGQGSAGQASAFQERYDVFIKAVSAEEFLDIKPERCVMVEAALLAAARGLREARVLARRGMYEAAAALLGNYAANLTAMGLDDDSLNAEIDELVKMQDKMKDREFSALDEKRYAHMSDMAGRSKKMALMRLKSRVPQQNSGTNGGVRVDLTLLPGAHSASLSIPTGPDTEVKVFLGSIYRGIRGCVPPRSYGKAWVLRERRTGRVLDLGSSYAASTGNGRDNRPIFEAGIRGGADYELLPLPAAGTAGPRTNVPTGAVAVDVSLLTGHPEPLLENAYVPGAPVCDFLALIYYRIKMHVPPNVYGKMWILRETDTGRVFDTGSGWAESVGLPTDTRPVAAVGIRGGRLLEVLPVPCR